MSNAALLSALQLVHDYERDHFGFDGSLPVISELAYQGGGRLTLLLSPSQSYSPSFLKVASQKCLMQTTSKLPKFLQSGAKAVVGQC